MNLDFDISFVPRFFRGLLNELHQKRLWPVAAVLVAAMVAVPFLLSSSPAPAPQPQAQVPAPVPAAPAPVIPALSVQSTPSHSRITGPAHDPFAGQTAQAPTTATHPATVVSTTTSAATTATQTATATTRSLVNSSSSPTLQSSSPQSSTPTPVQPVGTTVTRHVTYYYDAVDLTFGKVRTRPKSYTNAPRLHIFPSASIPVVVYLGVKRDGKTAVFLVTSRAAHTGGGTCLPSKTSCAFLDLKVGKQERFTVMSLDGTVHQYVLKVTKVHVVHVASAAAAARQATVHRAADGQKVVSAARFMAPYLPWPTVSASTDTLTTPKARHLRAAKRAAADQVGVVLLSARAARQYLAARAHHRAAAPKAP